MNGILWYDDNPRHTVAERVEFAALRCYQRTGIRATICHINPADANGITHVGGVLLVPKNNCLKNHYHAGVVE